MAELTDRMKYEAAAVEKFGWLSRRHRDELKRLLGSPPDLANVPESFWEKVREEHAAELLALLALLLAASATQHGLNADEATIQARDWAEAQAKQQAQVWVDNTREIVRSPFERLRQAGTDGAAADGADLRGGPDGGDGGGAGPQIPAEQIDQAIENAFGQNRVERMVATETTRAQHSGSEMAVALTVGISLDDIWKTENDRRVCPICSPLGNTPRSFWASFFPAGPPGPHPNCRCWIEYKNLPTGKVVTQ